MKSESIRFEKIPNIDEFNVRIQIAAAIFELNNAHALCRQYFTHPLEYRKFMTLNIDLDQINVVYCPSRAIVINCSDVYCLAIYSPRVFYAPAYINRVQSRFFGNDVEF